eukprot:scaffold804_cov165-Amphora_coffeaeformis.AAC.14
MQDAFNWNARLVTSIEHPDISIVPYYRKETLVSSLDLTGTVNVMLLLGRETRVSQGVLFDVRPSRSFL